MVQLLQTLKHMEYHGVRELARAAEHFLRSIGTTQEKGTVADYPNERTIRYYITEGLLDQAIEKRGVTSIFGYEHLLTLLVIKKLQALGLPISVIKDLIAGKSEDELEKLFGEEIHVFTDKKELDVFRASIGHTDDSDVVLLDSKGITPAAPPSSGNEAKEYLESLLMERSDRPERPPTRRPPPAGPRLSRGTSDWRRYEIIPGVELHVSRGFRAPKDMNWRQRVLVLIDGILDSRERR